MNYPYQRPSAFCAMGVVVEGHIMRKTWTTYLRIIPLVLCGLLSLETAQAETVTILRVIDGDTCLLEDGRRIRYLGIDSPEKGAPHAEEATRANNILVGGKTVRLESSRARQDRDNRLLAYVFVGDTFVNEELVRQGHAYLRHPIRKRYLQRFSPGSVRSEVGWPRALDARSQAGRSPLSMSMPMLKAKSATIYTTSIL